jgi:hypothetical protein
MTKRDAKTEVRDALIAKGYEVMTASGGFMVRGQGFWTFAKARKVVGITAESQGLDRQPATAAPAWGDYAAIAAFNGIRLN